MRTLLLALMIGCGSWSPSDPSTITEDAERHLEAMRAAMPPTEGDCDGVARMIDGQDPRGCRYRPTRSPQEVAGVLMRCAEPEGDEEVQIWQAIYGIWTGSPQAVSACASTLERIVRVRRVGLQPPHPRLPGLKTIAHGARWHAALAATASGDPHLIRGWHEVERALKHCGELTGPTCRQVFAAHGTPAQRIDLDHSDAALQTAARALDRLRRLPAPPP